MILELVVIEPFGDYRKGAVITDRETVERIKASVPAHHYVQRIASKA